MKDAKTLGRKGEDLAILHLLERDYSILAVNWQKQHLEIDIIAQKDEILVFVEVKSRSSDYYGKPESFVNPVKQSRIFRAANLYYEETSCMLEARFDIISVLFTPEGITINHFEDAIYPIA